MLNPYILQQLAQERHRELLREAAQERQWRALRASAASRAARRPLAEWLAAWGWLRGVLRAPALRRGS